MHTHSLLLFNNNIHFTIDLPLLNVSLSCFKLHSRQSWWSRGLGVGLRQLDCWQCEFESCRLYGCFSCECCVLREADHSSGGILPNVCVCMSINVIRCNMNAQHFKWVGRRGRTKREGREPVTKIPQMTPKLHTAHCSYNIYSVRSLKLHCHKGPKIRKFNFDSKCAAKTGFGKSS